MSFFLNDFDNAVQEADIFDAKVTADAEGISPTYKDLVIPVIRQVMTTLDITIAKNSDQSWNTSDVFAFMYDLGLTGFNGSVFLKLLLNAGALNSSFIAQTR